MEPKRNTIPVHRLGEMTDQGYHLKRIQMNSPAEREDYLIDMHRDDHYIFLLQERGWSKGVIEFESFVMEEKMIFCILPGQVHSYSDAGENVTGWFLALDGGLVPDVFRTILEDPLVPKKPLSISDAVLADLGKCLEMADGLQQQSTIYSRHAIYALLSCFSAMCTGLFAGCGGATADPVQRAQVITRDFRKLVKMEYKALKSPGEYAAALHLSLSYLNEVIKETTGFTVSYWIQQEILLEAKRLLYYNDHSVKEIAFELGYDDHTYFSRMFKKTVGRTPGEFRKFYHR